MSNLLFPNFPGLTWGTRLRPKWKTAVRETPSGREFRSRLARYPRYTYRLSYEVLRQGLDFQEQAALLGFINRHAGSFDTFLFEDPNDNLVPLPVAFGVGDGSTKTWQLVRPLGGFVEPIHACNGAPAVFANGAAASGYVVDQPNGAITFTAAPASGVQLTWSGRFYKRVRCLNDGEEFSELMSGLWDLRSLDLITVKAGAQVALSGAGIVIGGGSDTTPAVASVSSASAVEGAMLDWLVTLDRVPATQQVVLVAVNGVTGTPGSDTSSPPEYSLDSGASWLTLSAGSVTVPAGSTSFRVRVQALVDQLAEPAETVELTAATGANSGWVRGTGTILASTTVASAVRSVVATYSATLGLSVSFEAPAFLGQPALHQYRVAISNSAAQPIIVTTPGTVVFPSPGPGDHVATVWAVNALGDSAPASSLSVTVPVSGSSSMLSLGVPRMPATGTVYYAPGAYTVTPTQSTGAPVVQVVDQNGDPIGDFDATTPARIDVPVGTTGIAFVYASAQAGEISFALTPIGATTTPADYAVAQEPVFTGGLNPGDIITVQRAVYGDGTTGDYGAWSVQDYPSPGFETTVGTTDALQLLPEWSTHGLQWTQFWRLADVLGGFSRDLGAIGGAAVVADAVTYDDGAVTYDDGAVGFTPT